MSTTFHLDTTYELNTDFLKAIETLFRNQKISVTVAPEGDMDETEYLMSNEANRQFLEKSMKQIESGEIVKVKFEDL
jgi:hypothetical protein